MIARQRWADRWRYIGDVSSRVVSTLSPETHPIIYRHWPTPANGGDAVMGREVLHG